VRRECANFLPSDPLLAAYDGLTRFVPKSPAGAVEVAQANGVAARRRRGARLAGGLLAGCTLFLAMPAQSQDGGVGVTFDCPADECHVAPVTGAGGFTGSVVNADSNVSYAITCGRTLVALEAVPDSRGGVAVLFSEDNGLACPQGGHVEVRGLADGGWYWLIDYGQAAGAPLVAKDTVGNFSVAPWDPGSLEIDMVPIESANATLIWHALSGSLSILPHILPQPRTTLPVCGPVEERRNDDATEDDTWVQNSTDCVLGDGGTAIALRYGNVFVPPGTGSVRVYRKPVGDLDLIVSLWGNGTGHISTSTPVNARHGHYQPGATALPANSWSFRPLGPSPAATGSVTASGRLLTIHADKSYCDPEGEPPVNVSVTVDVTAEVDPAAVPVAPPIKVDDDSVAATRSLIIACPSAAANPGMELLSGTTPGGLKRR
jgi:hypothetical protein